MIEVRDKGNPERVLGRLVRRPVERVRDGDCVRMAVMPPMPRLYQVYTETWEIPATKVQTIDFKVSYRRNDGGYRLDAELQTDAPLQTLLMLREFRLPGETEAQAEERHWRA